MELTVRDVFNKFGNTYLENNITSYNRLNIYNKIKTCRTKKMGVTIYKCHDCGKKIYTYKSCMDRHCPACNGKLYVYKEICSNKSSPKLLKQGVNV